MKYTKIIVFCFCICYITACATIKEESRDLFSAFLDTEIKKHSKEYISTYIGDLDTDKEEELLVIYKDTTYITIDVYEVKKQKVVKSTTFKEPEWFMYSKEQVKDSYKNGKELVIYIKEHHNNVYIMIENMNYIDGGVTMIGAFLYQNNKIERQGDLFYENVFVNEICYSKTVPESWLTYSNDALQDHHFMEQQDRNTLAIYAKYYDTTENRERIYDYYFSNIKEVIQSYYYNYGIVRRHIFITDSSITRPHRFNYEKKGIIKIMEFYKTYGESYDSQWIDYTEFFY